jgi:hypothetical protein
LCKLLFPVVGFKMSSLPTLALKSPKDIFVWYFGNLLNTLSVPCRCPSHYQFYLLLGHECSEQRYHTILSLTNSTLLTADMILLCTKNLYLIRESHSAFGRKMCILQLVLCHLPPI